MSEAEKTPMEKVREEEAKRLEEEAAKNAPEGFEFPPEGNSAINDTTSGEEKDDASQAREAETNDGGD